MRRIFLLCCFLGVSSYVTYRSIDQLSNEDLNNCCLASLEFDIVFHVLVQCPHLFVPAFPRYLKYSFLFIPLL